MLRRATVVQQVVTELKGAETEEARAMVITKCVSFIMGSWPYIVAVSGRVFRSSPLETVLYPDTSK
jgi:hypothetical protein